MWGKRWAAAALLASAAACTPLAVASAKSGGAHPKPGAVFTGAPRGFGNDKMHWRVTSSGKAMVLVGSFAWSYGCTRPLHNYGIADPATLRKSTRSAIPLYPAPTVAISGSKFSGSAELQRKGRKYGRFTIHGTFSTATAAKASFSFVDPPRCGPLTFSFMLRAG